MQYLHDMHIVHRDIKPENILYTEEGGKDIKLIDFGYAGLWAPDKPLTGLCGTPDYVAPEVLTWYEDDEQGTPYGKGSDLWSMGVLLYVILSGCSPFSADEEEQLLAQVNSVPRLSCCTHLRLFGLPRWQRARSQETSPPPYRACRWRKPNTSSTKTSGRASQRRPKT